jgi:hypothetical protein
MLRYISSKQPQSLPVIREQTQVSMQNGNHAAELQPTNVASHDA